jgi:hypothetical protein
MDTNKPDLDRHEKLRWHPAFLQAIQLELIDYKDSLEFTYEYQLTTEPLRVDLLIIKKSPGLVIDKNIARIFRSDNILEFKSPGDYLSVKDFLKVYTYACLYAAITPEVEFSGITLTLIEQRHPRDLISYLTSDLEAWNMANSTKTFEEVFTEAGIIPQWIDQGKKEKALAIARNLLAKGWAVQEVAETTELPLEQVRSLLVD